MKLSSTFLAFILVITTTMTFSKDAVTPTDGTLVVPFPITGGKLRSVSLSSSKTEQKLTVVPGADQVQTLRIQGPATGKLSASSIIVSAGKYDADDLITNLMVSSTIEIADKHFKHVFWSGGSLQIADLGSGNKTIQATKTYTILGK